DLPPDWIDIDELSKGSMFKNLCEVYSKRNR
ncbi:uncharacterized protein METZ01_LOCUS218586, partial [marine metagenome]